MTHYMNRQYLNAYNNNYIFNFPVKYTRAIEYLYYLLNISYLFEKW